MGSLEKLVPTLLNRFYPHLASVEEVRLLTARACFVCGFGWEGVFKYHADWAFDRVPFMEEVYQAVSESGIASTLYLGADGQLFHQFEGGLYSLQRMVAGKPPTISDGETVAVSLADLHAVLARVSFGPIEHHLRPVTRGLLERAHGYGLKAEAKVIEFADEYLRNSPVQIVHGDLHPGNILVNGDKAMFIDFDSAHTGNSFQEFVLAAFRLYGADCDSVMRFIEGCEMFPAQFGKQSILMGSLAVHGIMRRLVFILSERERGITSWVDDLENQRYLLSEAMRLAESAGL